MTLRRRRRSLCPRIECLEARLVLANIGVNLVNVAPWTGDPLFVDLHNIFHAWGPGSDPWTQTPAVPVNSNSYPLENASAWGDVTGYPNGDYQLSYQGTGTVSFSDVGYLSGPLVKGSNGVTTGTVVINKSLGNGQSLVIPSRG